MQRLKDEIRDDRIRIASAYSLLAAYVLSMKPCRRSFSRFRANSAIELFR